MKTRPGGSDPSLGVLFHREFRPSVWILFSAGRVYEHVNRNRTQRTVKLNYHRAISESTPKLLAANAAFV